MQQLSLVHKEYKVLDIMKFAMAIVVVAIHTRPELSFSSPVVVGLFEALYTIAVPFSSWHQDSCCFARYHYH